jgi:hypothetical protein
MATKDAKPEMYRILARVGVPHQAIREGERSPQIPRLTSFPIRKRLVIVHPFICHVETLFSGMAMMSSHTATCGGYYRKSTASTMEA